MLRRQETLLAASAVALFTIALLHVRKRWRIHRALKQQQTRAFALARIHEMVAKPLRVPGGLVASEMDVDDTRLRLPASLGPGGRILLGDLGHLEFLLEGGGGKLWASHQEEKPIRAVLVCMGGAVAPVAKLFQRKGLDYHELAGCEDRETYPIIARHLEEAVAFLQEQLAAHPDGCVLVHCHEGKNRSATLCIAYLMVQHRMRLEDAVAHVWERRPIVLSNDSFVEQLVDLAAANNLL